MLAVVVLVEAHIVVWYSKHKSRELACCMDLEAAAERHTEIVRHRAENHSSYMVVVYSQMTRIQLDCLVLFPKEHNRQVLECHNSDSKPLLLGVVLRTHYTS